MAKKYPLKYLDAYTDQDTDIFFGRESETEELYEMLFQSDIILIYGASGTGKTSLIRCGLAKKCQSHEWMPLYIRRGQNINLSLEHVLAEAAEEAEEDAEEAGWVDEPQVLSPIAQSIRTIYQNYFTPIYLIFDQFEELFILGQKVERNNFIQNVRHLLNIEHPVKLIFSIREEYLGYLYDMEKAIPDLMKKKLRLEPMNIKQVESVIVGATDFEDSLIHRIPEETKELTHSVFRIITQGRSDLTAPPTFLQIVLDKAYRYLSQQEEGSPQKEVTLTVQALEEMGDIGNLLQIFLDEQVKRIRDKLAIDGHGNFKEKTIWTILSPFATREGTKIPITKNDIVEHLRQNLPEDERAGIGYWELVNQVVQALIEGMIVRYYEVDGAPIYEVLHDSLAKRIADRRSNEEVTFLEIKSLIKRQPTLIEGTRELFTERQLLLFEPYLERLQLSPEEEQFIRDSQEEVDRIKRRKQRRNQLLIIIPILLISFFVSSWLAARANFKNQEAVRQEFLELNHRVDAILSGGIYPGEVLLRMGTIFAEYPQLFSDKDRTDLEAYFRDSVDLLEGMAREKIDNRNCAGKDLADLQRLITSKPKDFDVGSDELKKLEEENAFCE